MKTDKFPFPHCEQPLILFFLSVFFIDIQMRLCSCVCYQFFSSNVSFKLLATESIYFTPSTFVHLCIGSVFVSSVR